MYKKCLTSCTQLPLCPSSAPRIGSILIWPQMWLRRVVLILQSVLGLALKGKGNVFYVGENQHRQLAGRVYHTSLHAEMNALFKSIKTKRRNRFEDKRRNKSIRPPMTIYVVRLLRCKPFFSDFIFGGSKPCAHCQKYLAVYNITRIKYTDIIDGVSVLCEMRLD